jgi:hypothetical protein
MSIPEKAIREIVREELLTILKEKDTDTSKKLKQEILCLTIVDQVEQWSYRNMADMIKKHLDETLSEFLADMICKKMSKQ